MFGQGALLEGLVEDKHLSLQMDKKELFKAASKFQQLLQQILIICLILRVHWLLQLRWFLMCNVTLFEMSLFSNSFLFFMKR